MIKIKKQNLILNITLQNEVELGSSLIIPINTVKQWVSIWILLIKLILRKVLNYVILSLENAWKLIERTSIVVTCILHTVRNGSYTILKNSNPKIALSNTIIKLGYNT